MALNLPTDEVFLTTEEVLEYLQVNLRTVYRLIKAGKIPAVRVGRLDGKLIANPTQEQREKSDLNLFVSCSETAITMVEGGASELPENVIVAGIPARVGFHVIPLFRCQFHKFRYHQVKHA